MKKLAILISNTGTGTNLQSIIAAVKNNYIQAQISVVISDIYEAPAVERAKKNKLKIEYCMKKEDLLSILEKYTVDYICLAGWKQFILDEVIDLYPNQILNLHPGIIPDEKNSVFRNPDGTDAVWNKGKLTDKAIQNFFDLKSTFAGSSVHFVTSEFDFGKVLGRCFVKINPSDTIASLYIRLKNQENKLYVSVLRKLCMEKVKKEIIVAVIDSGGRGAALVHAYSKSKRVKKIIAIPGNPLYQMNSQKKVNTYSDVSITDSRKIISICKKEKVGIVDVAQDDAVASGLVDLLRNEGFVVLGPTKKSSQIEWDKAWARRFMKKYNIPTPKYQVFDSEKEAQHYVDKKPNNKFFIKASGLAAGKGAIPAETIDEARSAILQMKSFGESGKTFVIEEWLIGEEFSFFAVSDGLHYQVIGSAQDHKRMYDNDTGPNTGGMGCSSNPRVVTSSIQKQAEKIIRKTFAGLLKEGRPYSGVLYLGAIVVKGKVFVIEFNARWGDPEAQVLIPGLKTDMLDIAESVVFKRLDKLSIVIDDTSRVVVTGSLRENLAKKQRELFGVDSVLQMKDVIFYPTRVNRKGKKYIVDSGRLFYIVGAGKDIAFARSKAYEALSKLYIAGNGLHFRTDIGWKDLERIHA